VTDGYAPAFIEPNELAYNDSISSVYVGQNISYSTPIFKNAFKPDSTCLPDTYTSFRY